MGRTIRQKPCRRDRLQGQKISRSALGLGPQAVVQIATNQQQEQQGDGGFKIGMPRMDQGLIDTDAKGQDDAERDGHIHIGLATLERIPSAFKERHPGIEGAGSGDDGGQPIEGRAHPLAHLLAHQACPDGDGKHHGIARPEASDAKGYGQAATFAVLALAGLFGIIGHGRIAKVGEGLDHLGRLQAARAPLNGQLAGGQVHARHCDAGQGGHALFDLV